MTQTQNILSRADAKSLRDDLCAAIGGRSAHHHIGTWLGRPGVSFEIRLTSKSDGRRIVVHKWDDEATCEVTYNEGNFWKDPENARTFGKLDSVIFTTDEIAEVARDLLAA